MKVYTLERFSLSIIQRGGFELSKVRYVHLERTLMDKVQIIMLLSQIVYSVPHNQLRLWCAVVSCCFGALRPHKQLETGGLLDNPWRTTPSARRGRTLSALSLSCHLDRFPHSWPRLGTRACCSSPCTSRPGGWPARSLWTVQCWLSCCSLRRRSGGDGAIIDTLNLCI